MYSLNGYSKNASVNFDNEIDIFEDMFGNCRIHTTIIKQKLKGCYLKRACG